MFDKDGRYFRMDMSKRYRLEKLSFKHFKNLTDLEIDFGEKYITGIFGANGLGKTTILSCVRCLYQPVYTPRRRRDGKPEPRPKVPEYNTNQPFGHVFYGNQFVNYDGSSIIAEYSDWQSESHEIVATGEYFLRGAKRWRPGTTAKPVCPVYYINMETCIPVMESRNYTADRNKRARLYQHIYKKSEDLRQAFADIFSHTIDIQPTHNNGEDALCITKDNTKLIFRDLSAGEQRILRVLDILFTAEEYSIILIDEIELTLHPLALDRLINVLNRQARKRHLQIIFTSHNQDLIDRKDIAVRSLHSMGSSIHCMPGYNPMCMKLLNGEDNKLLTIFMEDEMSKAIITTLLSRMSKLTYAERCIFGSFENSFKLACALSKVDKLTDKMAFVLDGDVVKTIAEKEEKIRRSEFLSNPTDEKINFIVRRFIQYNLPEDAESIESYFYDLIVSENDQSDPVVNAALGIRQLTQNTVPKEIHDKEAFLRHYKLGDIVTNLGYDSKEASGYEKVVEHIADKHPQEWKQFVAQVEEWVNEHC